MVDAIESSKYLTLPKTLDLVEKLEGLLPKTQARDVRAQVVIFDRVKNMNSKIHESLNTISTAIAHNRQIQYKYFDYDYLKQRVYRKNGAFYQVSPYDLVYTDDNYYLVGFNEKLESRTYRVDRMASVEMLSIPRNGKEEFGDPDKAKLRLQKSTFGMFTGKIETVTLVFRKVIMNPIIDRFGSDVFTTKVDDEHYQISVPVAISQQFFGWIFGLGDMITITAPAHIREQYMKRMLDIHKRYE